MSARLSQSLDVGFRRALRLDARQPLTEITAVLRAFRPDVLYGYPSILALLAHEQCAGRLGIVPTLVVTASEVRSPEMEACIVAAWGVRPFNCYASTETGITAVDCSAHRGLHVLEDFVIIENVDAQGRPVPDGQPGHRLLVTNLWARTQPLIRYELSDMVVIDSTPCVCGRTLRRIVAIDGRSDDVLELTGRNGGVVPVHPLAIRSPLAALDDVWQYQVLFNGRTLEVRVVPRLGADPRTLPVRIERALAEALAAAGAVPPPITVRLCESVPRDDGPGGKLKLIEVRRPLVAASSGSAPVTDTLVSS